MKVYQVGGSVRDELMGLAPKDYDYVVVGSSEEELLARGFTKVGKDFPVFHHPETKDEYALARREKKTGQGYGGFSTETAGVALEEDLFRRDLTINAMAKDEQGSLVDPFHGKQDLADKVLRHVSPHFAEDPLRVLRVARFAARYPEFKVHPETAKLMSELVKKELTHLPANRFLKEFDRALQETAPFRFFEVLATVGFFETFLPEFSFSPSMKLVDKKASSLAKMLALVVQQNNPDSFSAVVTKLGFSSSVLKDAHKAFRAVSRTMSLAEVAVYTLNTQFHKKDELRELLEEGFSLLGQDTKVFRQVEIVKATLKSIDFSFLEEVPTHDRKREQMKTLLASLPKD